MPDELEHDGLTEEEQQSLADYEAMGDMGLEEKEPSPAPETSPEAPPEAKAEAEPEAIKVPLHELKEERQRRQDAEQRLNVLMERTNQLLGQIQEVTTHQAPGPPDREEDPVGYLTWQNEQLMSRLDAQEQRGRQFTQNVEQEQAAQRFWNHYNEVNKQYAAANPDFKAATEFLTSSRRNELVAMGVTDPEQQDQILWQESFTIAAQAAQMGKNHAQIFHEMARLRGYQPSAAGPVTPATQPPVRPAPANLETVKKGQAAATSLSQGGGAGGETELTAEALISMSDEEFAAATSGKKWNRLHGK